MSQDPDDLAPRDDDGELQRLAGEYVLGTLDAQERASVERRLADDVALRRAVDAWEARLLPLTSLAAPHELPDGLWRRIENGLAARPATGAAARRMPLWHRWWTSLALWRIAAITGLAAAALLSVRPDLAPIGSATPQYVVVLVAPGDVAPGWIARVEGMNELKLTPLVRTAEPAGRALQLWTKADPWAGPVSLGLVPAGQSTRVRLDRLPPLVPNQLFEITLEPPTGSPIDRPTGPIQFIGRAVRLNG